MARIFLIFSFFLFSTIGYSQSVDFTYKTSDGTFCSPTTVSFTAVATGAPTGYVWSFGNGLRSYTANPSAIYTSAGNYVVKLIVLYSNGAVEVSKTVMIAPKITPSLSADKVFICQPGPINFTTVSNGQIVNYEWDYGDSTPITAGVGNNVTHNYGKYGTFEVVVKVTDTAGCIGIDKLSIDVKRPIITGSATPTNGCIPAISSFTSNVGLPQNSFVTKYDWDFNDGTPLTSTATGSINHTFSKIGSFSPTLSVTTNEGCTNNFNFPGHGYGIPPVNHIAYPKKTVFCGSETVEFVSKATNGYLYIWDYGDGTTGYINDTVTTHKYKTLGFKTVTVTPYFNSCPGVPVSFQVEVVGVIANFSGENTCSDKKTFTFTNFSEGNLSTVAWQYGDGPQIDSTLNSIHTYPDSGTFQMTLRVTDTITGCRDSIPRTIYTSNPRLLNKDSSICRNAISIFTLESSYENPQASFEWNVVGKQLNNASPVMSVKADTMGNFVNFVVISNGSLAYCPDTINLGKPILVRGPVLDFTMPQSICFNDMVNITNYSKPYRTIDPINQWYWKYGVTSEYDSIYQPKPIKFEAPGGYDVQLTAIDTKGCVDSLTKRVEVNPLPFLQVLPKMDTLCGGMADTLYAFHDNTILWSPAAGLSCNTCDTVIASPSTTTEYIVTATTLFNCTVADTVLVKVFPPFTAQPILSNPYICQNDDFTLDMNPKGKRITWSPAAGLSNPNIYNPVARPAQTTTYTALLTDSVGCFTDSASLTVFVKPLPQVDAGPDLNVSYNAPFTFAPVYSSNVRSYLWSPAAQLNCTTCPVTSGTALVSQTYTIEVTSDSGCVARDSVNLIIDCKDAYILMPGAFTPNNDNLNDYYYPTTRGIKDVLRFAIYNRAGQVMFEARNFKPNNKFISWDGYFKGQPQSASSFVYVLEALCDTGQRLTKSGSLVLLR